MQIIVSHPFLEDLGRFIVGSFLTLEDIKMISSSYCALSRACLRSRYVSLKKVTQYEHFASTYMKQIQSFM